MAVGLCFPQHGAAELVVIKEYLRENRPDFPLDTLEIDAIEFCLYMHCSCIVPPELDELLHKYYSDDETVAEVNLVRFLQRYLNLHRDELRHKDIYHVGQAVGDVIDRAKAEYETSYRLLPEYDPPALPDDIRDDAIRNLCDFIEYSRSPEEGIYESVA